MFATLYVRGRLDALQQEIVSLRAHKSGTQAAQTTGFPAASVEGAISAEKQHLNHVYAVLTSKAREAKDRTWSEQTEAELVGLFKRRQIAGTDLASASCSAVVCRIVLTHETSAPQKRLALAIADKPPISTAEGVYYEYPDDRHTHIYVIRSGAKAVSALLR